MSFTLPTKHILNYIFKKIISLKGHEILGLTIILSLDPDLITQH